ncbi:MAG: hypothetical protein Q9217_003972, partial [Psora testacea]
LDAKAFVSRKDQRQATNRWNQHVFGQDYIDKAARFCPRSRQEKKNRRNTFDLCRCVHEAEYGNLKRPSDKRTKEPIEPAYKFEVTLEADSYTAEKYALFENYQRVVHHEEPFQISEHSFRRFLCSGLGQTIGVEGGKEKRLGSYHQCYRLNGRLIAMGVLDLLPHGVSSVYLIYHEDFISWNFGKISALRETALALEDHYQYYYMGFYIHSCVKMRYKGAYRPTYVLDSITYSWDLLDTDMVQRLSARRFVSMALERSLALPAKPEDLEKLLRSSSPTASRLDEKLEMGNVKYDTAMEYVNGVASDPEPSILPGSTNVFEAGTPGAMSLGEVMRNIDLGQWGLVIGNKVVRLEDLTGWEESSMSDSDTIKGIAAELAACIGPDLVAKTLLALNF